MKLIDKAAVVAEIERRIKEGEEVIKEVPSSAILGLIQAYKNVLSFLDTLEVKEVDLNSAVERYVEEHKSELTGYFDIRRIARHFYKLGLNAQSRIKL